MIEISIDQIAFNVEVTEHEVVIEFEDEGHENHILRINKDIVTKICELMPNELIAQYVKDKQEAEKYLGIKADKLQEACRQILNLQGELWSERHKNNPGGDCK